MEIHHTLISFHRKIHSFYPFSERRRSPPNRRLPQMIRRLRHEYLPAGPGKVAPPRRGRNCSGQTCLVSRSRRDGGQVSFPAASAASFIHPASVFIVPGGVGAFICLATLTTPRSYFTTVSFSFHHLMRFVFCSRELIEFPPVRLTQESEHHVITCAHRWSPDGFLHYEKQEVFKKRKKSKAS